MGAAMRFGKGIKILIQIMTRYLGKYSHVNWTLADQTMVSGVNFLTGILLARALGITDFGRFSLAWLVVLFFDSIQHAAINAPMMSIGPKQEVQDHPAYYGGVFFQQAILVLFCTLLTWTGVRFSGIIFNDWNLAPLALPLAAAVLFCLSQEFLRRYFYSIQNPCSSFISDAVRYIGQLTTLFWVFFVLKASVNLSEVLWIIAGTSAAGCLVVIMLVRKLLWTRTALNRTALRNWISSKWLIATAVLQWLNGNLLIVSAGALLGTAAVGALKAAQNLMGVTHILFKGLDNIVPVRAAQHHRAGGTEDLMRYLTKTTLLGIGVTAAIALFFAVNPAFWLDLLFGQQFAQYGYLVRWYAVLYILIFLGLPLRFGLRVVENTAPIFTSCMITAGLTVAIAYPLVGQFGLIGVMVGMISIQIVTQSILWVSFRKTLIGYKA